MFITFEGGEGAGKSTLIDRLAEALLKQGKNVLTTRAPGSLKLGSKIRDLLLHSEKEEMTPKAELFLFLADRASHVEQEVKPALKAQKIVLCDRFNDSTIAYQGIARGLGEAQVAQLCAYACDGLQPDITFYLDLDPRLGLKRAKNVSPSDRIESETLAFHEKIRQAYLKIAKEDRKRVHVIDASRDKEHVFQDAWSIVERVVLPSSGK
jgi:dTMP kinase